MKGDVINMFQFAKKIFNNKNNSKKELDKIPGINKEIPTEALLNGISETGKTIKNLCGRK